MYFKFYPFVCFRSYSGKKTPQAIAFDFMDQEANVHQITPKKIKCDSVK